MMRRHRMKPKKNPAMGVHKVTNISAFSLICQPYLSRLHVLFSFVVIAIYPRTSAMMAHAKAKTSVSLTSLVL